MTDSIRMEILLGSHQEHFKVAKDMSMFLDIDNPRRKRIEEEANRIIHQIQEINDTRKT